MKNIIKLTTLILGLVLVGCNAVDDTRFKPNTESGWIEFSRVADKVLSTDGSVQIPFEYNVPVNRENTIVSYDVEIISGEAPSVETGSFTTVVPADTRDIDVLFDVDPNITSNYTIQYTITSVSNPDVIVGLDGDNPIVYELEVCADILPLAYTGVAFIGDSQINTFDVFLTRTDDCDVFEMNSAWGTNFVAEATGNPDFDGQFIYEADLTLNPDFTVTITGVGDDAGALPGSVPNEDATNGNVFDLDTGVITYSLSQGLFANPFVVDVVLTPAVE
ncbi:hypothetical protein [Flavobacteriaceae bacterium 14752]|uniref:hypothetical protein n=1 Tax=Mesohalobacter salilacus TaxID=2491711 RepID=UPI000F636F56|nr:hypothetical protein EIG84_03200 [Flavobacteriaceae bacterium 14752]